MRFRIDLKIFLFLIVFYFTKQIEIYILMILFAIIHELGHLVAGILLGFKPEKLELIPVGLTVSFRINLADINKKILKGSFLTLKQIIVALAGPITNIIIVIMISMTKMDMVLKMLIIYINLIIAIFNLLPIYPLDGGRILKGILHILKGKEKSEKLIYNISIVVTLVLTTIASIAILYVRNIAIFIIIIYIWYIVIKESIIYNRKEKIYEKVRRYDSRYKINRVKWRLYKSF